MYSTFSNYLKKRLIQEREYERLLGQFGKEFPVYLNPTNDEFRVLSSSVKRWVRGILDYDGNVYVWDGESNFHSSVAKSLGIDIKIAFYTRTKPKGIELSISPGFGYDYSQQDLAIKELTENDKIQRMLSGLNYTFLSDAA